MTNYSFDEKFCAKITGDPVSDIFDSQDHKAVGVMIDRITYMGAAELFLEENTSLLQPLRSSQHQHADIVIAAVLERQIQSLEESKWKPTVSKVIDSLFQHLVGVSTNLDPIRRAKVGIAQLEHMYFSGVPSGGFSVEELTDVICQALDQVIL